MSAQTNLIEKLRRAGLTGRGGAAFPTWQKWQSVKEAKADKKYLIANGSEGEPGVIKDGWLLENKPKEIVEGIKLAMETVGAGEGIVYLRHDYYDKFKDNLTDIIENVAAASLRQNSGQAYATNKRRNEIAQLQGNKRTLSILKKKDGYIGGEETALISTIEGSETQPKLRPPYPTTCGLYGYPTLINNLETLYEAYVISQDRYQNTRLFSITGDIQSPGVYEFSENSTIKEVLIKTKNLPQEDFFVQVGGAASGIVLNSKQLDQTVGGMGAIAVYDFHKTDLKKLLKDWVDFFAKESCGKCVPCREGTYRLKEVFESDKPNWGKVGDILFVLEQTSFCALGGSVPTPIVTLYKNIGERISNF